MCLILLLLLIEVILLVVVVHVGCMWSTDGRPLILVYVATRTQTLLL